jgi:hypothetical protein
VNIKSRETVTRDSTVALRAPHASLTYPFLDGSNIEDYEYEMPPPASSATGLTITNPLILYRALLSTKIIDPDPAQHRLALELQKL